MTTSPPRAMAGPTLFSDFFVSPAVCAFRWPAAGYLLSLENCLRAPVPHDISLPTG